MADKKIVIKEGTSEIVEKRSRFIGRLIRVSSEEEIDSIIKETKKKYFDARHNCFAYVLGNTKRASDDGEPQGTAGKPILEVIEKNELADSLIIVTRYFGGTLLGTGGLVRAYTQAAVDALNNAVTGVRKSGMAFKLDIPYTMLGKVENYAKKGTVYLLEREFTEGVSIRVLTNEADFDTVKEDFITLFDGAIEFKDVENCFYVAADDTVRIL